MNYIQTGYIANGYFQSIKPPKKNVSGREPIAIIQIDQDFCNLTYGESPCNAELGVTGSQKCYNTRKTCQDGANFDRGTKTLNFAIAQSGLSKTENIFPLVRSYNTAPTKLNPFTGNVNTATLGERSVLTVQFRDAPHTDNVVDPYLSSRDFNPLERGTFWGKWLARNYYQNREIRLYEGFVGDDLTDMNVRHYLIDAITIPNSAGQITLTAKDPLKLVDKERAQIPQASTGIVAVPFDSVATSFIVIRALLADYDSAGLVRIGEEILEYTSITDSGGQLTFNGVTRGQFGSTASGHGANDAVQKVIYYQNRVLWQGIKEFLVDWAGVDPIYIDDTEWSAENAKYLAQFTFTSVLSVPKSVFTVLNELTQQIPFYVYWDERANKIRFEASRYYAGEFPLLTENEIIANTFNTATNPRDRISQVWIYHSPKDWTKNETSNYTRLEVNANLEIESRDFFDEKKIRVIKSDWIGSAQAIDLTSRLIRANFDNPLYVKFQLDSKDDVYWVGDVVDIKHRSVVDFTGEPEVFRYLIYGAKQNINNGNLEYEAIRVVALSVKQGIYMANDAPNYDDATPTEKENGGWYANNDGLLPDNELAYEYE
jgi:hypothetical protein